MRVLGRILKWGAAGLGSLVGIILLAVAIAIQWPSLWFNSKTARWGARQAKKAGFELSWQSDRIHARNLSLLTKRFDIELDQVCFKMEGKTAAVSPVDACFGHLEASATISLKSFPPRVEVLGPVVATRGQATVEPAQFKESPQEKKDSEPFEIPDWIKTARLAPVRVEVDQWKLKIPGQVLTGNLHLRNEDVASGSLWRLKLEESLKKGAAAHQGDLALALRSESGQWKGPWKVSSDARVKFRDGKRARASLQLQQAGEVEVDYQLEGSFKDRDKLAEVDARGRARPDRVQGELRASASNWVKNLPRLSVAGCAYDLRQVTGEGTQERADGRYQLRCPVKVKVPVPPKEGVPDFQLPAEIGATLFADLRSEFFPSAKSPVSGAVSIEVDPVLSPLFRGQGKVAAQVGGVPEEFPDHWQLDTELALSVDVPEFKRFVDLLHSTPWAIPAPLNSLRGKVGFGLRGEADLSGGRVPLFFETDLRSSVQRVSAEARGEMRFTRPAPEKVLASLNLEVLLREIKIVLPRLGLEAPPRLFPDSRVLTRRPEPKKAGENFEFDYRVHIATPPGSPAQLVSNRAKSPVPLHLDLTLAPTSETNSAQASGISGSVRVGEFKLDLFRRDAQVERFQVSLERKRDESKIDGSIRFNYTDYVVRVLLFGQMESPQVKFLSEPPLPEEQIIATLLFGRPIDELDPDQQESVGSMQAALVDQALSLASLYLFASGPIQRVSYDPDAEVFSASFRLGGGTSVSVGADTEQVRSFGVRKRLSRRWSLVTDVERESQRGQERQGQTASAFLEWSYRY